MHSSGGSRLRTSRSSTCSRRTSRPTWSTPRSAIARCSTTAGPGPTTIGVRFRFGSARHRRSPTANDLVPMPTGAIAARPINVPVSRLTLTDFRSYASATIEPGAGFVLLSGDNGAGKTNLLEAVSLLAPGRGLRGAALSDMARKNGAGAFAIAATIRDVDIGTGTVPGTPERR